MSNTLKTAISLAYNGQTYSAMSLAKNEPELAAMISKMIPSHNQRARFDNQGALDIPEPNAHELRTVSENVVRNITDTETVLQVLPDLEHACLILVSCVLAPKDMLSVELTYGAPKGALPPEVSAQLVNELREYFEVDYNIKALLPAILTDCFLNTGSYPIAVLAENAIDEIINNNRHRVKLEELSDTMDSKGQLYPLGVLGPAHHTTPQPKRGLSSFAVESLGYQKPRLTADMTRVTLEAEFDGQPQETYTSVCDNPNLLRIAQITEKLREQRVSDALGQNALAKERFVRRDDQGVALEDKVNKLTDKDLYKLLYKSPRREYRPLDSIRTQERLNRRTVGAPLVLHLPSESVIPVYVPGNVKQQVGFFVLIDQDGNPLSRSSPDDVYGQLANRMNSGGSFSSAMMNKVKANISGFDCTNRSHLDYSAKVYGQMMEADWLSRLRNGNYANGVALTIAPEMQRLLLSRALSAQHTQMLFLPVSAMTYFAFNYNTNGVGKSYLDDIRIITSIRMMLSFSNTMASMKNSIGRTKVDVTLSENDPDPQKTIDRIQHEIARTRQQAFPIGVTSPIDLTDYLQRAAFEFGFSGHPRIPTVAIEYTQKNDSNVKVDTELEDEYKKRSIQKFGIPAQMVDASYEPEFAKSVVTDNIMVSKTVMQIQDRFEPQLADHLHKVAATDSTLIRKLRKVLVTNYDKIYKRMEEDDHEDHKARMSALGENFDPEAYREVVIGELLEEFVTCFTVSLPRPNSVSLSQLKDEMDTYEQLLDKGLEQYFSTATLNKDTIGDISEYLDAIKESYKAYYMRAWMAENGVLTELAEITELDDAGKPKVDLTKVQTDFTKHITSSLNDYMKQLDKTRHAANELVQRRQAIDNTKGGADATSTFGTSGTGSDSGGFDFGGDLLGGGLDTGLGTGETQEDTLEDNKTENGEAGETGTGGAGDIVI